MAILKPDSTITLGGVTVNEYLLTKHNPNKIDMPSVFMEGKIMGVTVHNTDRITTAAGTTPADQYTRATVNGNMNDVRVHFYCDNTCAWQNLPLMLPGWHAADGSGNSNRRTVAIECIMSSAYNDTDKKSEDNCARLAAALLKQFGLGVESLYTHTHWLNVMKNSYKMCPIYILPHWAEFKAKVQAYPSKTAEKSETPAKAETKQLYRVRKTWDDAKSQVGAYKVLENAVKACPAGYYIFDVNGNVASTKVKRIEKGGGNQAEGRTSLCLVRRYRAEEESQRYLLPL